MYDNDATMEEAGNIDMIKTCIFVALDRTGVTERISHVQR